MVDATFVSGAITLVVVSVVAVIDYRRFRIPNSITIPFASTGLAYHYLSYGMQGLLISLFGLILGVLLLIAPYILRGFGGGDVKLLGAMGAWLGANELIWVFIDHDLSIVIGSSSSDPKPKAWFGSVAWSWESTWW
jgi:prepilin peptidase CpaA